MKLKRADKKAQKAFSSRYDCCAFRLEDFKTSYKDFSQGAWNAHRQTTTAATIPAKSAVNPAGIAWRVR
jgi:hypothetical protein